MAAVARLARRSSQQDPIEAEMAARSARRAAEQAQKESQKVVAEDESKAPEIKWGQAGVHALLDDDFVIESSPPPPARRANGSTNGDTKAGSKPAGASATPPLSASKPKTQAYPVPTSGWAPNGFASTTMSTKDIISAGAASAPSASAVAQNGTGSLDQAVALLGEALREERKRSEAAEERCRELEDKVEQVKNEMLAEKQKVIEMLEARLKLS